jgi:hypothetical protein
MVFRCDVLRERVAHRYPASDRGVPEAVARNEKLPSVFLVWWARFLAAGKPYQAVEKRVHVHDLHATMLHLMGLDHEKLTYRYSGRDSRLTDVHGTVVKDIIA